MMRNLRRDLAQRLQDLVGLGLVLLFGAAFGTGCSLGDCLGKVACCRSCEATEVRQACECEADEQPAFQCPRRSACALAHYVGDGPASCCRGGCDALETYEQQDGRCEDDHRYLHECAHESDCFQVFHAKAAGAVYVPWKQQVPATKAMFQAVWGADSEDVWVVGLLGQILHLEGQGWQTVTSPSSENLQGVWGSSADDIWAVGWNGTILHYDGSQWSSFDSPTDEHLLGVWGRDADHVWAVGTSSTVLRYDGGEWKLDSIDQLTAGETLRTVVGDPDNTVWVAGHDGVVLSYDGERWARLEAPDKLLSGLWFDGEQLWVVGEGGTLSRRRDGKWEAQDLPVQADLTAIRQGAGGLWAVGERGIILRLEDEQWKVTSYYAPDPPADLLALWGDAQAVWAVGTDGAVLAYEQP